MEFKNITQIKDYLWEQLGLANRAITFSVIDVSDDNLYFESGIIDCSGDLWESDALTQIGTVRCDDEMIDVTSVESYMIGDGESEHADYEDLDLLADISEEHRDLFDEFIRQYAEPMASIYDFEVENPEFDGESEDYDD